MTMNLKIYAIFDKLQNTFHTPMFQHNDGTLIRVMTQAVNDKESFLYKSPQDYAVYEVGQWDDVGTLVGMENNRKVIEMLELVDKERRVEESELEKINTNLKQMRAVVDSLKTLVVGKEQAM